MMGWKMVTRAEMRQIVRKMTARYTPAQMQNTQIDTFLNRAYNIHFPLEFRNLKLNKPVTFLTTPNVDTYDFVYEQGLVVIPQQPPSASKRVPGNITINPPVYCQGYLLNYFENKATFYSRWPNLSVNQQIGSGNDTDGPYSGIIPSFPFYRAQLDISGNVTEPMVIISAMVMDPQSALSGFSYAITDKPQIGSNEGRLFDSLGNDVGFVNYLTGEYEFTVANSAVIPGEATIYAAVVPYQAARPVDMLFYNQQLVLRPCPYQIYQVEFQVSQQPMDFIGDSERPELDEWYLLLCALAAKLIYNEYPDPEGEANLQKTLDEQTCKAQRRTLRQIGTQRAQTLFSQPRSRNALGYYYGNMYSGSF